MEGKIPHEKSTLEWADPKTTGEQPEVVVEGYTKTIPNHHRPEDSLKARKGKYSPSKRKGSRQAGNMSPNTSMGQPQSSGPTVSHKRVLW